MLNTEGYNCYLNVSLYFGKGSTHKAGCDSTVWFSMALVNLYIISERFPYLIQVSTIVFPGCVPSTAFKLSDATLEYPNTPIITVAKW